MGIHFTDFFAGHFFFLFFSTGRGKLTRDWQPQVLQCVSPENNPTARLYGIVLAICLTFCIKYWLVGYTTWLSKKSCFMHLFTTFYTLNETTEIIFYKMKLYQSDTALPKQFFVEKERMCSRCCFRSTATLAVLWGCNAHCKATCRDIPPSATMSSCFWH